MKKSQVKNRVSIYDLGLFIRMINMEYNPKTDLELCTLIEEEFNVICEIEDLEHYHQLHIEYEDYEKLSRMVEYNYPEFNIE